MSVETIELFEDGLSKDDCEGLPRHFGARALVMVDSKCVLLHNGVRDLYTLPGGQIEVGETAHEAVRREVLEETGYRVKNVTKKVRVVEYFSDSVWDNLFFYCEADEPPIKRALTEEEAAANLTLIKHSLPDALALIENYQSADIHAEAIHRRELIGMLHTYMDKPDAT